MYVVERGLKALLSKKLQKLAFFPEQIASHG